MTDEKSKSSNPLDSKSAEILQDFVSNLLSVPDSSVSFDNMQQPVIENISPAPLNAVTYESNSSDIKPLLSERLKLAQNLLKDMPKITEIEAKEKISTQFKDVPDIISKPILSTLIEPLVDDIEIVEEEAVNDDISAKKANHNKPIVPSEMDNLASATVSENTSAIEQKEALNQSIQKRTKNFSGAPDWGKGEFQTLTFNIGELKLAVPLIKLGGIHRISEKPSKIAGRPPWYMGLMPDELGNISLIDTALWIMPEQYDIAKAKGLAYDFIVLLDDTRWGLACSKVHDAITLTEDDVKWSAKGSKRPWLAGMLVDKMCALLDVDVLIDMLNDLVTEPQQASQ